MLKFQFLCTILWRLIDFMLTILVYLCVYALKFDIFTTILYISFPVMCIFCCWKIKTGKTQDDHIYTSPLCTVYICTLLINVVQKKGVRNIKETLDILLLSFHITWLYRRTQQTYLALNDLYVGNVMWMWECYLNDMLCWLYWMEGCITVDTVLVYNIHSNDALFEGWTEISFVSIDHRFIHAILAKSWIEKLMFFLSSLFKLNAKL